MFCGEFKLWLRVWSSSSNFATDLLFNLQEATYPFLSSLLPRLQNRHINTSLMHKGVVKYN